MSVFSNPASSTPSDIAAYVAALLELLGDADPVTILRETPAAAQRFLDSVPAEIVITPGDAGQMVDPRCDPAPGRLRAGRRLPAAHDPRARSASPGRLRSGPLGESPPVSRRRRPGRSRTILGAAQGERAPLAGFEFRRFGESGSHTASVVKRASSRCDGCTAGHDLPAPPPTGADSGIAASVDAE